MESGSPPWSRTILPPAIRPIFNWFFAGRLKLSRRSFRGTICPSFALMKRAFCDLRKRATLPVFSIVLRFVSRKLAPLKIVEKADAGPGEAKGMAFALPPGRPKSALKPPPGVARRKADFTNLCNPAETKRQNPTPLGSPTNVRFLYSPLVPSLQIRRPGDILPCRIRGWVANASEPRRIGGGSLSERFQSCPIAGLLPPAKNRNSFQRRPARTILPLRQSIVDAWRFRGGQAVRTGETHKLKRPAPDLVPETGC